MSEPFDVNAYWLQRGHTYASEPRLAGAYHLLQESFLVDLLKLSHLPTRQILDVGCGHGRVTQVLAQAFPDSVITAVDLSPEQLENARRRCATCTNIHFAPYDFYSGLPIPGGNFDVAVASEVFLHHPGESVKTFIRKITEAADYLVNIDWCEDWQSPVSPHVWIHNYRALYQEAGLACAGFAIPQMVDGKQQRLFVAGRELPADLTRLERLLAQYRPDNREPRWESKDQTPRAQPPTDWKQAVQLAAAELAQQIPSGATCVLVDEGQWPAASLPPQRRFLPFLEKDGHWWGPPENDEVALRELERLRQAGAGYFVLAWPAFWWMEHYARFLQDLRQRFPCPLSNERLMVFQLT